MEVRLLLLEKPLPLYLFGTAVALGVLVSLGLLLLQKNRPFTRRDTLLETLCFLPVMLLGARACYYLVRLSLWMETGEYGFFFRFQNGGFMIHGALLAAPLAALLFARATGKPAMAALDDLAPSFALVFAAAYLGEHLIGQGRSMLEVPAGLRFPPLSAYSAELDDWLYSVALWECLFCLALYPPVRWIRFRQQGDRTLLFYLALCGGLIFFSDVENDAALSWGFVRSPQVFSVCMLILLFVWRAARAHHFCTRLFLQGTAVLLLTALLVMVEFLLDRVQAYALLWYGVMIGAIVLIACLTWRAGHETSQL